MDDMKKFELGDDEMAAVVGGMRLVRKCDAIVGRSITVRSAASCC